LALVVLEQAIRVLAEVFLFMLQLVAEALPEPLLQPEVDAEALMFPRELEMQ
jgi:hypothetical protein